MGPGPVVIMATVAGLAGVLAFHTAPARLGAGTLPAPVLRQPLAARVVAAAIVSIAGSLGADAALVAFGTASSLPLGATCTSSSTTTPN
jgi:hypothetical protein